MGESDVFQSRIERETGKDEAIRNDEAGGMSYEVSAAWQQAEDGARNAAARCQENVVVRRGIPACHKGQLTIDQSPGLLNEKFMELPRLFGSPR